MNKNIYKKKANQRWMVFHKNQSREKASPITAKSEICAQVTNSRQMHTHTHTWWFWDMPTAVRSASENLQMFQLWVMNVNFWSIIRQVANE